MPDAGPSRPQQRPSWLFLHSSDEWYGADRMLVEFIESLPTSDRSRVLVWLPDEGAHGDHPLCEELTRRDIAWEHRPLPVLRRSALTAKGLVQLSGRLAAGVRDVRRMGPDNVVLATSALLPVAPFLPHRGMRVILHLQEMWAGREGRVLARLAHRVDRVIAISAAVREPLPARLQDRTIVVPNGTPAPAVFRPLPDGHTGPLTFVMAGRWNTWKGHDFLLSAWKAAQQPGHLVILGGPPPLGESVDVPRVVAELGLEHSVTVVGEVERIDGHVEAADVMVVPSTRPEPFGLVTIEAFARGRPVIATAHGGSREVVTPGTGWLVDPNDVDALAEVLRAMSRDQAVAAGAQARRRYLSQYTVEAFHARLRAALAVSAPN